MFQPLALNSAKTFITLKYLMPSVSMDQTEDCHIGVRRPNNDMLEGDIFLIKSDNWNGKPSSSRQPAECLIAFNLGNRLLSVDIRDWSCDDNALAEPLLAFYDNFSGERRNLMVILFYIMFFNIIC